MCNLYGFKIFWDDIANKKEQLKSTMDKMIKDKITIDLNVFSLFMEDIIVSNMNGTLVVAIKKSSRRCRQT